MAGFKPTRPRGDIEAMFPSPGPRYKLPNLVGQVDHDPRSVHMRCPAYKFGQKFTESVDSRSPGPVYQLNAKCTRNGMDGTPKYSLYGRPKETKKEKTPGPGAHMPENAGESAKFRHPAYSLGSRRTFDRTEEIPAPNAYSLDTMIGRTVRSGKPQAPSHSLSGRLTVGGFCPNAVKTPGPGAYDMTDPNTIDYKAPLYSMSKRDTTPSLAMKTPGPGAYHPETVNIDQKSAPKYSFGVKHSPYITLVMH